MDIQSNTSRQRDKSGRFLPRANATPQVQEEDTLFPFQYTLPFLPTTPSSSLSTQFLPSTPSSSLTLDSFTAHRTSFNPTADSPITSPLTDAPPTPPTPPEPVSMNNRTDLIASLPTFDGGEDVGKENPRAFIAKVRRTFLLSGLTDEQKIAVFELSLVEGGPAKEWFDGLAGEEKTSWNELMAAFDTRWPARVVVAKTAAEKQDDLRQHVLKESDLLRKQELTDGREAYSHVVWAEKALRLAKLIPDTNHLLVPQSKAQLPEALRDCLADDCDTWEVFTEAVKNVKLTKLREKMKKREEEVSLRKKVESLENANRQPQTPSKLLANTLSRFRLSTPIPQPNFGAPHQTQQRTPSTYRGGRTEAEKWNMISRIPDPLPDTPANRAAYRDNIAQWH
ncbi:hypothetical protein H0H92_008418 [Tricholoma furcatifolium]|nr:hypothetical protein H0H92_008418 [Tricholoma furcatifolium]